VARSAQSEVHIELHPLQLWYGLINSFQFYDLFFMGQTGRHSLKGIICVFVFLPDSCHSRFKFLGSFTFLRIFVSSGQKERYPQKMQIAKESPDVIVKCALALTM